jgi:hypothetical protein
VVLQPDYPNARYNLGVALGDAEQYTEAIDHLQHVIAAEPQRAEAYNSLGYLFSRQRQPQKAVEYYERALQFQPDYAQAHFNLGMTLLQLGNYQRGWAEYDWRWRTGQFTPYIDVQALRRRRTNTSLSLSLSLSRSPSLSAPPRVGIVWAGSPTHSNDRHRSCPLQEWLPLLGVPGMAFYSLQKGERSRDLTQLPHDIAVHDLEPLLGDCGDLAVLLDQLDIVISVDTSVAHVAGAIGKQVWTLLSYVPDWRWGLAGETTPWYPTMLLFRQEQPGDWAGVMTRVTATLQDWQCRRGKAPCE